MRTLLLPLLLFFIACTTAQPPADPGLARAQRWVAEQPANPAFRYVLARHYDRLKETRKVLETLTRLERMGWTLGVEPSHFRNTRDDAGFREVAARLDQREQRVHRAATAFVFPRERNVRSEGIAYDAQSDHLYFSGAAGSLLRVTRTGEVETRTVEPEGRSFERLGMTIDGQRRLWVVAAVFDSAAPPEEQGQSVLSVYDLRDGSLVRRVQIGSASERVVLNDLTLMRDGTAYVTDNARNLVLRLRPEATAFETLADGLRAPNGITLSRDETTLYVADFFGIHAIDVAGGSRRMIAPSSPLNAIDGLVAHGPHLLAIQNNLGRARVLRIDPANGKVEVLEAGDRTLHSPSTGVVADGAFYLLANRFEDAERRVLRIALP